MLQLDFGCGENPRKGFVGIDVRELKGVQYVIPSWEADRHFKAESVDEIHSRYMLQHLTFTQAFQTLRVWFALLKPSAVCEIVVPDFNYYCQSYLRISQKDLCEEDAATLEQCLIGIWGRQRNCFHDNFDVHKSGYDFKFLCSMFLKAGFKTVFRINDKDHPEELRIMAQKRGPEQEKQAKEFLEELKTHKKA